MRRRLTKTERRTDILEKARRLIAEQGFTATEMEDIRLACGMSRGGLYHHFSNKRAVLAALVEGEVMQLAAVLTDKESSPIPALLRAGASHLGNGVGVLSALETRDEKLEYLSALEQAFAAVLLPRLGSCLIGKVRDDADPAHVAELFLAVNAHVNRREILGQVSGRDAAGFAATALVALTPLLKSSAGLDPVIADFKRKSLPR